VFDRFIESGRSGTSRHPWPGGAVAFLAHVAIGAVAVWATLPPRSVARAAPPFVIVPWPDAPPPVSPRPSRSTPDPSAPIVGVPVLPPIGLPALDARTAFDAGPWLRALGETVRGSTPWTAPGAPWSIADVEDLPDLLSGPVPVYPERLRRAGIAGRVVVEAVIDTIGRAEPGSVRVIETHHPGFDAAARDYVLRALFRPARVNGRPVRVLVRVPIEFALQTAP
jgi:periplasmic protein TonB